MQKKLLASLLAVPMVYSAFADINVDLSKENWATDGSVGGGFTVGNNGADVSTQVGVANVSKTVNFYTGTYKLSFTKADNIVVSVNAYLPGAATPNQAIAVTAVEGEDNTYTFTLGQEFANAEGQVKFELVVAAKSISKGFSFEGLDLGIDCDFEALSEAFEKRLDAAPLESTDLAEIPEDFPASEEVINKLVADTTGLGDLRDTLEARVKAITDTITGLAAYASADSSVEAQIKAYEQYQLYKFNDTDSISSTVIDVDLKALIADIEAYNNRINHFNGYIENLPKNIANHTRDTALLAKFQDSLNALAATTVPGGDSTVVNFIKKALEDSCALAQDSIDAFRDTLNKVYANFLDADTLIEYDNASDSLKIANRLAAVNNAIKDAQENVAAYDSLLAINDTVFNDFSAALSALNALKANETYVKETKKNPVADLTAQVKSILNKKYAEYLAVSSAEISTAKKTLAAAKEARAAFDTFLTKMDTIKFAGGKGIEGLQDTVKFANDTIKAFYTTYGTDSTGLLGQYNIYLKAVKESTTLDTTVQKKYLNTLDTIDSRIAELKDSVYAAYQNLTAYAAYNDSVASINDLFASFDSFGKILDLNLALAAQRDSLKQGNYAIEFTNFEGQKFNANLENTFKQTLDNLQAGITALDPDAADLDATIEGLQNSIDAVAKNADTIVGFFNDLDTVFNSYKDSVNAVNAFIKAADSKIIKSIYVPAGYEYYKPDTIKAESVYKDDFIAPFNTLNTDIPAAMQAQGNNAFIQFRALINKVFINYQTDPKLETAYEYGRTASLVKAALYDTIVGADIKTVMAVNDSIGKLSATGINSEEIKAELEKYTDSIAATKAYAATLKAADFDQAKYDEVIDTLGNYITNMTGIIDIAEKYAAATKLYDELAADTVSALQALENCKTAADKDFSIWATSWNNDSTLIQAFRTTLATDSANTVFQAGKFGVETNAAKSLTNDTEVAALKKQGTVMLDSVNGLLTEIQTSVANKKALATVSAGTRNFIQNAMGNLLMKKAEIDNGEQSALLDSIDIWYEELTALLTSAEPLNVLGVDGDVTDAYKARQLGTEASYNGFKAQYDDIKATAQSIINDFQSNLDELVNNYNQPIIENLNKLDAGALTAYNYAVREYNQYVQTVTNKGYLAAEMSATNDSTVKQVINDQNGLYALLDKYEAASDTLGKYLSSVDNIIPQSAVDYFEGLFNDNTTETWETLVKMQQNIAGAAQKYFVEYGEGVVFKALNDTVKALTDANTELTEAIAKDAVNVMTGAFTTYTTADSLYNVKLEIYNDSTKKYASDAEKLAKTIELGLEMNNIANLLDKALAQVKNFSSDNFATTLWNSYVTNAKDSINGFIAGIKNEADTNYCYAPDSLKSAVANDSLPQYLLEIDTIATTPTVANITDLKKTLDEIFDKAKVQEKKVRDASKLNGDAAEALAGYRDSLANLQEVYNYTDENIFKMAGAGSDLLKTAAATLTEYEAAYEEHKGELNDDSYKAEIAEIADKFRGQIVTAANNAVAAEKTLIEGTWYDKLTVAYNNANVFAEKDDATKATLAAAQKYIAGLKTILPTYTDLELDGKKLENNDTLKAVLNDSVVKVFVDSALVIEGQVGKLYDELCGLWTEGTDNNGETITSPKPMEDAMAIVNAAKEAAKAAIDEYNSTLAAAPASVKDKFTPVSEGFANDMTTADNYVESLGDRIILDPETAAADYTAIANKVTPALEELKEAKAAAEAEEARVASLTEQAGVLTNTLTGFENQIADLKATVAGYDETLKNNGAIAAEIDPTLDELAAQVASDKAGVELALQSAINNAADSVKYAFKGAYESTLAAEALKAADKYADGANNNLVDAYTTIIPQINAINIAPSIKDSVATKIKEIEAAKAHIADSLANLKANTTDATVEAYTELADQALAVVEQLNELLEYAKTTDFVLGDVDGTPGVNVTDLMTIMDWVGEGLTLEEVSEEYGAAVAAAADITGDGALNIADVTAEANLIMGNENGTPALVSRKAHADAGSISLSKVAVEDGITRYAVSIDSKFTFVGGLIDIKLAEGASLVGTQLISNNHGAYQYNNENGARLILMSLENAALDTQDNVVLYIDVEGAAPEITVGQFTDKYSGLYNLTVKGQTGIEDINAADNNAGQRIYNVAGQSMRAIQRGINIIRHADGTTTKEYHK